MAGDLSKPDFEKVFSSRLRVRILWHVLKQREEGTMTAWLVKDCRSDSKTVQEHLNFLVRGGFLVSQEYGRVKIYRARFDNPLVQGIKNLFEFWMGLPDWPDMVGHKNARKMSRNNKDIAEEVAGKSLGITR